MYGKILKRDLKRKKTMNLILLLFIILAAAFMASSMNNAISIITALDGFFEKAGISDFTIIALWDENNHEAAGKFLSESAQVEEYFLDQALFTDEEYVSLEEGSAFQATRSIMMNSLEVMQSRFFDEEDKEIAEIEPGEIYMNGPDSRQNNIKEGDCLLLSDANGYRKEFVVRGTFKDAFLGSAMMGLNRFLLNEEDFNELYEQSSLPKVEIYSVYTSDIQTFEREYNEHANITTMLSCNKSLAKFSYVMDMMIAIILLVVSVCLILISMLILRFTIVFTLQEEYREIGVMKAIGISGRGIRKLYLVKYLLLSLAGAAIGFGVSIPFGKMLMKQVSQNMVMNNGIYGIFIGLLGVVLVVAIIMLFSYTCTCTVMGFSPIDAIRNGSNGERFHRKGLLRLHKCRRMPAAYFMAVNDIISSPRRFSTLFLIFTLGTTLILISVNSVNTLSNDNVIELFGMMKSDAYLASDNEALKLMEMGNRDFIEDYLANMEEQMTEHDIRGKVVVDGVFQCKITLGEEITKAAASQGIGTGAEQYPYLEGYSPKYENEAALSHITAEAIGAEIGDRVMISIGEEEKEFIVSALFQTMNNQGEGIRFSEKTDLDYTQLGGTSAVQIIFADELEPEEMSAKRQILEELFPQFTVYDGKEFVNHMMGDINQKMADVKKLVVAVVLAINGLVAVLMVKTFITREKGEIGILKSIGFSNNGIIRWQVGRISTIMVLAVLAGMVLSDPLGQISSGAAFRMMGVRELQFTVEPMEVYVLYPILLLVTIVIASLLTAQEIRRIPPGEVMNME